MEYEHTQYGYTGILTTVLMVVVAWFSLPETFSDDPRIGLLMAVFMVGLVAFTFWFSKLKVLVSDDEITTTFGLGKPHRVIQLSEVAEVRQARNTWIQGWGVRKVPRGWMYNVWGLDAVELELTADTIFRIGTDDAERLHASISLSSTT
jgi:hypothetical protein